MSEMKMYTVSVVDSVGLDLRDLWDAWDRDPNKPWRTNSIHALAQYLAEELVQLVYSVESPERCGASVVIRDDQGREAASFSFFVGEAL